MTSEERKALPVREACKKRMPLGGADAECLEHALTITERERDEARAKLCRAREILDHAGEAACRGLCEYNPKGRVHQLGCKEITNFLKSPGPCRHEEEAKRLRGVDRPFPTDDLLEIMIVMGSHLLYTHNCDCHEWERWTAALTEAELRRRAGKEELK